MGEKTHLPQENGMSKPPPEQLDQNMPSEDEDGSEGDDEMSPEEFQMLDKQLDALNSALDSIEQRNDSIHAELLELLQSNREIRQQLQETKSNVPGSSEDDSNKQMN